MAVRRPSTAVFTLTLAFALGLLACWDWFLLLRPLLYLLRLASVLMLGLGLCPTLSRLGPFFNAS